MTAFRLKVKLTLLYPYLWTKGTIQDRRETDETSVGHGLNNNEQIAFQFMSMMQENEILSFWRRRIVRVMI